MTTQITNSVDQTLSSVMARITEAATKHDIGSIEVLSRAANELKEMRERAVQLGIRLSRIDTNRNGGTVPTSGLGDRESRHDGLREFRIQVTDGSIRQNLLTMTEPLKSRKVQPGESFLIEAIPSGERFKTVLLASGNKMQERGAVCRFYRDAHVQGGDEILLTEVSPGEWTLKKSLRSQVQF